MYVGNTFYDGQTTAKIKNTTDLNQGVEPDPNRIRKPVLTVIIF